MKLTERDTLFIRRGFGLEALLNLGGSAESNIKRLGIRAKVVYFDNGVNIDENMIL